MFNLHLSVDQENRERQGLEARDIEAGLQTEVYSEGYFEGYIGLEPSHPESYSYWEGYQIGCMILGGKNSEWSYQLNFKSLSHL